ncbi:dephospho-CoA kinase [Candidatus Woesearchaeota archaeon]|nr:dephospho-CoA kinase [Candidatus Woesearchaeota archaeon]HII63920.1 dephospho-CoA kinase [Candidatus Woesearchaeota archaeon]
MKKRMVIGITGSIGTGKTAAARHLGRHGFAVINVDRLYRRISRPGSAIAKRIARHFGKEVLLKNGSIDRATLKAIVFKDPRKLRLLNSITHPLILKETKKLIGKSKKTVVIDAPLLLEARFDRLCDYVVVTHAPKNVVLRRLLGARKLTKREILSIMGSQMPFSQKRKRADSVVDTSGSYAHTHAQLRKIISRIKEDKPI